MVHEHDHELRIERMVREGGDIHIVVEVDGKPVSYTHLDVYKRQQSRCATVLRTATWSARRRCAAGSPAAESLPWVHGRVRSICGLWSG